MRVSHSTLGEGRSATRPAAIRTAVVLAAGRGSRMGVLSESTPKPLVDVAGRSLIERILRGLSGAGVERAVVVVGYLGERVRAALGSGDRFDLLIDYVVQERADGTARALVLAEPSIGADPFLVTWADILVDATFYGELAGAFAATPCDVLLAVNRTDDPWRGAAVDVDAAGRVTRLVEKPPPGSAGTSWNNAGVLVLTEPVFAYARRVRRSPRGEYELPMAIADMIDDGAFVRALPIRGDWFDVGTPQDLSRAAARLAARAGTE